MIFPEIRKPVESYPDEGPSYYDPHADHDPYADYDPYSDPYGNGS
jgi:hypothetical protein